MCSGRFLIQEVFETLDLGWVEIVRRAFGDIAVGIGGNKRHIASLVFKVKSVEDLMIKETSRRKLSRIYFPVAAKYSDLGTGGR
jgi:hypothetical protein